MKNHIYKVQVDWTGNTGQGTKAYNAYSRDHIIFASGKPGIPGSSDPSFRGDPSRYNPEELLVASLSTCHMLWYLHLCADNGVTVVDYKDPASGLMEEHSDGSGEFVRVVLKPMVTISPADDYNKALDLHNVVHKLCFIARSVKFPVVVEPLIERQLPTR